MTCVGTSCEAVEIVCDMRHDTVVLAHQTTAQAIARAIAFEVGSAMAFLRFFGLFAAFAVVVSAAALAEESSTQDAISIELNTVSDDANGCTLTFVATNGHPVPIEQLVFEAVLFDQTGAVNRLSLFDFGHLPEGRPRVRQFAVQEITCEGVGRILFNGLHSCKADGLSPDMCETGLNFSTRSNIEVLG